MRKQFLANGFVVLRSLLSRDTVDAIASSVSKVVAEELVLPRPDGNGRGVAAIVQHWPTLAHHFHAVNRSHKLHVALSHIFGSGQQGYRFMERNELSIDHFIDFHQDALGTVFTHNIDAWQSWQNGDRRDLLNVGVYLQEETLNGMPELEVLAGSKRIKNRNNKAKVTIRHKCDRGDGCWHLGYHPRIGDAVIFDWAVQHRTGGFAVRQDTTHPPGRRTKHRGLFNIGYGQANELLDCYAKGFYLRDDFAANPTRYGCVKSANPANSTNGSSCLATAYKREFEKQCDRAESPSARGSCYTC